MLKKFEDLKGKVLTEIIGGVGKDEMVFVTADGEKCKLYYEED